MNEKQKVIKWYKHLGLSPEMDSVFYSTLERTEIPEGLTAEGAGSLASLGERGGIWAMYFLENMESEYLKRGLFYRFESDLVRIKSKIEHAYNTTRTLDLGDLTWERHYLMAREFKIGRLYFTLGNSPTDVPAKGIATGDRVVQIHVGGGSPLAYEECLRSISEAKKFVSRHFPDFTYRYFTCLSWLLDPSIADLLGEGSNVIRFASLFERVASSPSDNILRFVFGGGTTRATLPSVEPKNRFTRALKEAALSGRVFYDVRGVIDAHSNLPWEES